MTFLEVLGLLLGQQDGLHVSSVAAPDGQQVLRPEVPKIDHSHLLGQKRRAPDFEFWGK